MVESPETRPDVGQSGTVSLWAAWNIPQGDGLALEPDPELAGPPGALGEAPFRQYRNETRITGCSGASLTSRRGLARPHRVRIGDMEGTHGADG
jgi:hypothetical protein